MSAIPVPPKTWVQISPRIEVSHNTPFTLTVVTNDRGGWDLGINPGAWIIRTKDDVDNIRTM